MKELEKEVYDMKINQFKTSLKKDAFKVLRKRKFVVKNPVLEQKLKEKAIKHLEDLKKQQLNAQKKEEKVVLAIGEG